ncbi:hypothetical protein [Vibrio lentus]|uniref:hypothetical protein n=1 Tax=Vibrio lentus TaxID=136468 RepID=UPI000C8232F3|nr:hypothetical protein [Vibrio lentus]PMG74836.1 hypothetical protein BCU86_23040 [Vibrio lentus]
MLNELVLTILSPFLNIGEFFLNLELIRTIIAAITLLSILIAYASFISTKAKQKEDLALAHDKEIVLQAKVSLEWAYESLELDSEGLPNPDRISWLTSSRHILRYYLLRDCLKTKLYKTICAEHEEYWSHKFYILFSDDTFESSDYFSSPGNGKCQENIVVESAMVLSAFSNWQSEVNDPLDSVDQQDLINKKALSRKLGKGIDRYRKKLHEASLL